MPLEILVTMVVCGVVAIAIILHMSGRSAVVPLTEDSATRAWLRHSPDSTVQSARPAATGHAALITTEQGMGIVWCFGADTIARPLDTAKIEPQPKGLCLRFADFSTPSVTVILSSEERAVWKDAITAAPSPTVLSQKTG